MTEATDDDIYEGISDALGVRKCCATCKHWDQMEQKEAAHFGACWNTPSWSEPRTKRGHLIRDAASLAPITTDLTLCSRWEQKDDE